jgi:hypothetical protein
MSASSLLSSCQSCGILKARVRADLEVYLDTVMGEDARVTKDIGSAHRRVERARLAYTTAREKLVRHVGAHD